MEVDVGAVPAPHASQNENSGTSGTFLGRLGARGTYPSILINLRSPPKYLAYNLEIGNPYPNPAMGALKSLLLKSGSRFGVWSTVVYMYVQTRGIADLGMPPPSSEILIVMSSLPSAIMTFVTGKASLSAPCVSTTARREFFKVSNSICDKWPGTYMKCRSGRHTSCTLGASKSP